jgi:hypothetical protein
VDLAGLQIPRQNTPVRFNHDAAAGIGHTDRITIERGQLLATGLVSRDTPHAHEAVAAAKNGFEWQASIGASVQEQEYVPEGKVVIVNGREWRGPLNVVRRSTLGEISLVDSGADIDSHASIAAQAAFLEESAPMTPTSPTDPTTIERERVLAIEALTANHPTIRASAILSGWSPLDTEVAVLRHEKQQLELAKLRDSRPVTSDFVSGSRYVGTGAANVEILTAGLLLHVGYSRAAETHLGARTTQLGHDLGARSLLDLCAASLRLEGRDVPRDTSGLIRAAFSMTSMPYALGESASKIALENYRLNPATWRAFSSVQSPKDFKPTRLIRAVWGGNYEPVPPTGHIKHGDITEETYVLKLDTHGQMFGIDRTAIINDDLQLFMGTAAALGRAGARVVSDEVYRVLLANQTPEGAAFYSAGNSNLMTTGSELSATSLATAMAMLTARVDAEGKNIDIRPRVLLVPPELEFEARQLLSSAELARNVSADDNLATGNPLQGVLELQVEPRLSNVTIAGFSVSAWYVFASPADAGVVVGFLNGKDSPTVEEAGPEAHFDRLGAWFRGIIDFGVSLADARTTVQATGAAP